MIICWDIVITLRKLKTLYLSSVKLKYLPDALNQLPHLTVLDISMNRFDAFPEVVCTIEALQNLNLEQNNFQELSPTLNRLTRLTELNLSGNHLGGYPLEESHLDVVFDLPNLRYLDVSNMGLETLSDKFSQLTNLDTLDVSQNTFDLIEGPPSAICRLPNLTMLHLAQCNFQGLSEEVGKLTNMRGLNLSYNSLGAFEFPEGMRKLVHLIELQADSCDITTSFKGLSLLTTLQLLFIDNNDFSKGLPPALSTLSCLKHLSVASSNLRSLPKFLLELPSLESINVSGQNSVKQLTLPHFASHVVISGLVRKQ